MGQLRSPIPWIGGKHYSAQFIVSQLPDPKTYDVFGGGANILLTKPAGKHLEVYNDLDEDLVNCWMHLRDYADEMQSRLSTLPYSRVLYSRYHHSLYDGTEMTALERAVRWYYVLKSSFRPEVRVTPCGWRAGIPDSGISEARTFRMNLDFTAIATRFQYVAIDCRDFEAVIRQYESPKSGQSLLYCDPPYIDAEAYYKPSKDTDLKTFHERLARTLNATPAMVALSYYEHPWLDELYPIEKWRRVSFETVKHSQRTKATRDRAQEVLLCNYPARVETLTLWDQEVSA